MAGPLGDLLRPLVAARRDPVVALFASLPWEIDTRPIADAMSRIGAGCALPAFRSGELEFHRIPDAAAFRDLPPDRLGIPTPPRTLPRIPLIRCAAVIVPGLAFDPRGYRLGQGGGFYDRALAVLREYADRPPIIGIGMDLQRRDTVPTEPHDEPVDRVITPAGPFAGPERPPLPRP